MKEIIANEGMWLTQATLDNEAERGFWKRLTPAYSLSESDFTQWSDAQKEAWETEYADNGLTMP
jgi:hypothetical protein